MSVGQIKIMMGHVNDVQNLKAKEDRIAALEVALKPFAFLRASLDFDRLDDDNIATVQVAGAGSSCVSFFVRDVLAARKALGGA